MNTEQTDIIPVNTEIKKRRRVFPALLITVTILTVLTAVFIYGIIIGGKYAVNLKGFDPDGIPVTEYIVKGLQKAGKIDFSITLGEKEINETILLYEQNFAPLKNVYLNPDDGSAVFSGQIEKSDLKSYLKASSKKEIPEIIWIFVPEVLNIKAEVSLSVEDGKPTLTVNGFTVLNSDNSKEIVSLGGFSDLLQEMTEDIFSNMIPENIKIETVTLSEEGIRVSGEIGILNITE